MMDPNNLPHHVYLHKDHKYRLKLGFYAAPSNPKAFSKAIRDELHNLKFTYCSDLNGLIMGFGKISSNELIPADIRHCINVVVNVDVYIFKPPVGSIIEAVVNQTSDNHVSCLVHNLFNVSIVRPENKPCDQWSGSKIKKDDKIDVKVLSFDLTKKLPHITGEIIKKKDECYDPKNIKNSSSSKSLSSKNIVSDFTKSFNKNTAASPSTFSSNDSESSDEMNSMITESKICADESTKTSPLLINTTIKRAQKEDIAVGSSTFSSSDSESSDEINNIINKSKIWTDESTKTTPLSINTTIKRAQKEDTAVSSSKLPSSDSESSTDINNMITSSKICEDKTTKKSPVSTNTSIKHQDTDGSSSECSSSNSEFPSKIKDELTNFKECGKNKSTRTSSCIPTNIINSKHIESPLYSSTPILNSEHSVNSINVIRNKQLEQLKKHLVKNGTGKRKSLGSVKVPNQFNKDKLSQSLNILQNINNNDNPLEVLAASVNTKDNLGSANKINQHDNLQGDSDLSDSEFEHNKISVNNSFSRKSEKSTKTTKKHKKSNTIVDAILNSISLNKIKSDACITKHLVDSNDGSGNDEKDENTIYTQHKHNLDEGLLINPKNINEPAVKKSLTLNLSTKNIRREDTPQKKKTDDSENQIKNKISEKCSNVTLSMISDSDSNCSKELKLPVKDLSHTTDFNKEIENDTSSSDDEIYSKLKQNVSKTQINTNYYNEKPKSPLLDYNKVSFSTDESDSSSKLFYSKSELSSQLIKSNVTNMPETDGCNKSNDNILLSNKKTSKKDKKKKKVNEKSTPPQLSKKIVTKVDIIKQIMDQDSSSDGEVTTLKNKTSEKKKKKEKVSRKKSILNVTKLNQNDGLLNKDISNPFLKIYTEHITSSSSDDESFVINLLKSKKKSSGKKKSIPLVNEEEKKNILINQVLSSLKRKNKKQKQSLPVSQNNSKASECKKKLFKNDKITIDKSMVKTENKKDISNILKSSIGEPKPKVPNLNISQKDNSSQLNIQPSSNESSDEEKDIIIKKILKNQKLKKTKKAYLPEQSMKINIPIKSNKKNEIKEKLHTKSESQNVSTTDELKSNDKKKKKRPRETKNSFVDNIISALENSSSDHAPSKKKKKEHNLAIEELHDSKNSDGNLSEVKMKKKKKSKLKDNVSLIDSIVKDKKKKPNDSIFESLPKNVQAKVDNTVLKVSKKKKKSDPVFYETQSIITDKSSKIIDKLEDNNVKYLKNAGSSKKKTKKLVESQMKNFMLTQDTKDLDKLYDLLNTHLIQS